MAESLIDAARRGVRVRVVVDGFGSMASLPTLRRWFDGSGVALTVFRPLDRWYAWLQPGQLRRRGVGLVGVGAPPVVREALVMVVIESSVGFCVLAFAMR